MGFLGGLLNAMNDKMQIMGEKSEEYYNKYAELWPEKILKEMDSSSRDFAKMMALKRIYAEKACRMSNYELKRITEEARNHCTANTYNYALEIYQKETNKRDPWT